MLSLRTLISLLAALCASAGQVAAQDTPVGVWMDHTGRGAIEIAPCGEGLCGHVVWIKDQKNASACRTQIIGDVQLVSPKIWDKGWIYDPDANSRFNVELRPVGADRLKVTGYMGTKLLSETMLWKRAPASLKRCDLTEAALPAPAQPKALPVPTPTALKEAVRTPPPVPPARQAVETSPPLAPEVAAAEVARPGPSKPYPQIALADDQPDNPAAALQPAIKQKTAKRRGAKAQRRKFAGRDCRIVVPFVTIVIPCSG